MKPLKITEELAADIRARVKSLDFGAIEKSRKSTDNGTFDVIISTEDTDRSGEIVKQNGWELANYKNNPIVLWGHDYYSLPIGVCLETYITEHNGVPALGAKGVFLSADINPFAQQVRKLYEFGIGKGAGVGCTTSVGFIPKEFDENARNTITKAELLEFSFVPIPANQGVGPAHGRALTFEEAKELDLDVAGLRVKGIEFAEKTEDAEEKAAAPGDDCSMADGSAGEFATDPDDEGGAMVCIPKAAEKAQPTDRKPEKELIKSLHDEHTRHVGEVEKALDDFREKAAEEGKDTIPDALKELRSVLADEQTMHRARAIASVRGFEPDNKAFDKKGHLKALREEDDSYEARCNKSLELFEEHCAKGMAEEIDGHIDGLTTEFEAHQRTHKKSITKAAKAMCRDAFGEEDQADEQIVAILKEYLTPHIDPLILNSVISKVGARISSATREKLREAHENLKAASAIVEALHGNLGDGDGEEGRSDDEKSSPAPVTQRSRPVKVAPAKDNELESHLFAREILRGVTTAATAGLKEINEKLRANSRSK